MDNVDLTLQPWHLRNHVSLLFQQYKSLQLQQLAQDLLPNCQNSACCCVRKAMVDHVAWCACGPMCAGTT